MQMTSEKMRLRQPRAIARLGYKCRIAALSTALLGASAAVFAPSPATAHPHVWIEARLALATDDTGKAKAVTITWQFDEYYTATAIQGLDKNKNGAYEPQELHALAAENIKALKEYRYFTRIKIGGEVVKTGAVETFSSEHKGGLLHLTFTVPLAQPVSLAGKTLEIASYDPSFFISIEPAAKTVMTLPAPLAKSCNVTVKQALAESDSTQDIAKMLKRLGDANEGMGAQFARPVAVTCPKKTAAR